MAVRLSALRAGRLLPPRKIPGTHFCLRLRRPKGHSAAGTIRSIEKSNDLIGNRTANELRYRAPLECRAVGVNEPVCTEVINSNPISFINFCRFFTQTMAVVPSRCLFLIPKIRQCEMLLNGGRRWGAESIPVSYKQQMPVHSLSRTLAFSNIGWVRSVST
jgi:hypothetical protein